MLWLGVVWFISRSLSRRSLEKYLPSSWLWLLLLMKPPTSTPPFSRYCWHYLMRQCHAIEHHQGTTSRCYILYLFSRILTEIRIFEVSLESGSHHEVCVVRSVEDSKCRCRCSADHLDLLLLFYIFYCSIQSVGYKYINYHTTVMPVSPYVVLSPPWVQLAMKKLA